MDIKENLAKNLMLYRKANNLTQLDLAQKLNYSDKAVSKWERGESVPDLYILKKIADFYGVTIDMLISEPTKEVLPKNNSRKIKRTAILLCSTGLVWLVAVLCFAMINLIFPSITHTWLSFFYAIPITFILLLVFTAVWKKPWLNTLSISLLIWSILLAVFITLLYVLPTPPKTLWMIFLIGIPLQALTLFYFMYRKSK